MYQSQARDIRYAYGALGTISDANKHDSSALEDGDTKFLDALTGSAQQQAAAVRPRPSVLRSRYSTSPPLFCRHVQPIAVENALRLSVQTLEIVLPMMNGTIESATY